MHVAFVSLCFLSSPFPFCRAARYLGMARNVQKCFALAGHWQAYPSIALEKLWNGSECSEMFRTGRAVAGIPGNNFRIALDGSMHLWIQGRCIDGSECSEMFRSGRALAGIPQNNSGIALEWFGVFGHVSHWAGSGRHTREQRSNSLG